MTEATQNDTPRTQTTTKTPQPAPAAPETLKPKCDSSPAKSPLEKLAEREAKARAEMAKAQAELAKIREKARKIDTSFKIRLGGWVIAAVRKAKESGIKDPIVTTLQQAAQLVPLEKDLLEWLNKATTPEKKVEKSS